jgi:RNA polymerase sigma-70 factor (ECF subfamily)
VSEFGAIFDRHWRNVFLFCYYRLGDWHEAEDAASQVFENAFRAVERFHSSGRPDGLRCWLFTIAKHVVANVHRHRARHPVRHIGDDPEWVDPSRSPEDHAIVAEEHRRLRTAIQQLPSTQRETLELRLAGLTTSEIARVRAATVEAVRAADSRGVRALRELMAATLDNKESSRG